MTIIHTLLKTITANAAHAQVADIRIGAYWTAVALRRGGNLHVGLSSALRDSCADMHAHHYGKRGPVSHASHLLDYDAQALAELALSSSLLETSVGFATLNALLDVDTKACIEVNAADIIAERGAGRNIAIVGHFPFLKPLRQVAQTLWVLELNPREDDLPAAEAPHILPQADVVAITGTSLLNGTFESLITHCRPDAFVIMLGATTPISPVLFESGVDAVSGTLVTDPSAVLQAVSQGATFKQIPGKRLLTLFRE